MPKYRIDGLYSQDLRAVKVVFEAENRDAAIASAKREGMTVYSCEWVRPSTELTGSTWLPPKRPIDGARKHSPMDKERHCANCDRTSRSCTGEEGERCPACGVVYDGSGSPSLEARLEAFRARKFQAKPGDT